MKMNKVLSATVFAALTLVTAAFGFQGKADAATPRPQLAQNGSWVLETVYCVQTASRRNPTRWRTIASYPSSGRAFKHCEYIRRTNANVVCRVTRKILRRRVVDNSSLIELPNVDHLNQALPSLPGGIRTPPRPQPDPSPLGRLGR